MKTPLLRKQGGIVQRPEDETPAFVAKTGMCPQAHAIMKKVALAECPPATAPGTTGEPSTTRAWHWREGSTLWNTRRATCMPASTPGALTTKEALPGSSGGFKKDAGGELILSKLNEITLQKIALQTGGSYVRSVTGNLDLEEIYQKGIKQRIEQKELKSTRRKRWEERFQWFALIAFVLVIGESLLSEKKRVK